MKLTEFLMICLVCLALALWALWDEIFPKAER